VTVEAASGRSVRVKIASEVGEFEQAFRLLADRYRERGYDAPSTRRYRYTPHHALPGTVSLVAVEGARVLATLSMVPDNELLGLPMESVFGDEVEALRREGRRLGEVISLAEDGLGPREFLRVFGAMIRLVIQYHLQNDGDSWVIAVNPRHRSYYRKALGFIPLGECRSYAAVRDNPAEAFLLDLNLLRRNAPSTYREIFREPLPRSVLTPAARPADHARRFGPHSTQADFRTILGVLEAGARDSRRSRWEDEGDGFDGSAKEDSAPCGFWHSRRCSPIAAGC
jgi:hypothetical protein